MKILSLIIGVLVLQACSDAANSDLEKVSVPDQYPWAFPSFVKQDEANPIMSPDPKLEFICPIDKSKVKGLVRFQKEMVFVLLNGRFQDCRGCW